MQEVFVVFLEEGEKGFVDTVFTNKEQALDRADHLREGLDGGDIVAVVQLPLGKPKRRYVYRVRKEAL